MKGEDRIFVDFEPNDFVIRVTPVLDEHDRWTGDMKVGYLTLDENYLSKEDYQHVDLLTNLMLASVPLMEEDIKFRNTLYKFHEDMLRIQEKPKVSHTEDNVVHLDFGNKEQET
tara:strand:+ start:143 stop:484 length:342 start_codon:yes stop_codon:yes gene_type:complete